MRKKSREMDSQWALEVMHKAPYITVSFIDEDEGVSKHKIIKEKDSLYVFILAYNESLFFE